MRDQGGWLAAQPQGADGIERFASRVVELLASRGPGDGQALRTDLAQRLIDAVVLGSAEALDDCLAEFRRQRVTVAALADTYVPEAARQMGQRWVDDTMTFADVSMAATRLQALLRGIGGSWSADAGRARDGGAILLAVPEGEQHTLGPMIVMGRLRRMGVSVCMRLAPVAEELRALMQARAFDGAFVSVSARNHLAAARVVTDSIRSASETRLTVIVGGPVLALTGDARDATGADLATSDLTEALSACSLFPTSESQRKTA